MSPEEIKSKRIDYLQEVLWKYENTEPKLSQAEIAYAICWQMGKKFNKFLKAYEKEIKKA